MQKQTSWMLVLLATLMGVGVTACQQEGGGGSTPGSSPGSTPGQQTPPPSSTPGSQPGSPGGDSGSK